MKARRERHEALQFDPPGVSPLIRSARAAVASLSMFGALAVALVASMVRVPGPAGWTYPELVAWIERRPAGVAFCLLSTVALIVVVYLMLSIVALVGARTGGAARRPRLERVAQTVATPAIRRPLAALLGLSLTVAANSSPAHGHPATIRAASVATAPPTADSSEPTIASMRSLEGSQSEPPAGVPSPAASDSWTVRPGDHLWGLAESTLAAVWTHDPSDADVADYVHAIIDLNREVLVVPGHPDLILPGQVFTRPAIPER